MVEGGMKLRRVSLIRPRVSANVAAKFDRFLRTQQIVHAVESNFHLVARSLTVRRSCCASGAIRFTCSVSALKST